MASAFETVAVAEPEMLKSIVEQSLDADKAEDITEIDLAGKTTIADYMVVATGRSTRHVASIADRLTQKLKQAGAPYVRVEGLSSADWVILDCGDIVVHLFRPEARGLYNIEKMWSVEPVAMPTLVASDGETVNRMRA